MKVQHTFAFSEVQGHPSSVYVEHELGTDEIAIVQFVPSAPIMHKPLLTINKREARRLMDGLRMILNLRIKSRRHRSNKQVKQ